MAKRRMKKPINKETKVKEKKVIKKQNRKNSVASRKPQLPKSKNIDSTYQSKNKLNGTLSLKDSAKNKIKVLLPDELLEKAKNIIGKNKKKSIYFFKKALKIYDINDQINFRYLRKFKRLSKGNYKYIYTLSLNNRKKIVARFKKSKANIFAHPSKQLFYEFVNLLLEKDFDPDEESSMQKLEDYKVNNFDKFIIPINEGTEELKYYYFMNIIWSWINSKFKKSVSKCLKKFKRFFKCEDNINKINEVFIYYLELIGYLFIIKLEIYHPFQP